MNKNNSLLPATCYLLPVTCSLLPANCYLSIDSASSILSVAINKGEQIFYKETEEARHSESAMALIDDLMKTAALKPSDLAGVVCMKGPGSFTGLRIGYSIAKGLALSLSIPFTVVPTLDCMALPFRDENEPVLCAIQSKKNAWFYSVYKNGVPQSAIKEGDIEQLEAENIRIIYKDRGYAKELLEIGSKLEFTDSELLAGPEYVRGHESEVTH